MTSNERVHAICKLIRGHTWAGIDESKTVCHDCPAAEDSSYGPGTRGCYLLAQEVFNMAVHGGMSEATSSKTEVQILRDGLVSIMEWTGKGANEPHRNIHATARRVLEAADGAAEDGVWIHVREGMTLGQIGRLIDRAHETKPTRDADHCDYPDCEQHWTFVVEQLVTQCESYHRALDTMFALMIEKTAEVGPHCFFPSKSGQPWEACQTGNALIQQVRAAQKK